MDQFAILSAVIERVRTLRRLAAVATVIAKTGSAPQALGARIALFEDGFTLGTIGGGAIEFEILALLKSALHGPTAYCHTRHLTRDLGMCCGGSMSFFIEPIQPPARLLLFGAGHVAQPTALIARASGFEVVVIDERTDWNNQTRFVCSRLILDDGTDGLKRGSIELGPHDYVVICTHSHRLDEELVTLCARQRPGYLGMIGSRRKAQLIRDRIIQREPELSLEWLHSPVGLNIHAREPGEIAVSIVAELIALRRAPAPPQVELLSKPAHPRFVAPRIPLRSE